MTVWTVERFLASNLALSMHRIEAGEALVGDLVHHMTRMEVKVGLKLPNGHRMHRVGRG